MSALRVLERRKLIRRVARPGDRRAIRVYLTVTGRKLEQEVIPKIVEVNARVVRGIAPRDLAVFPASSPPSATTRATWWRRSMRAPAYSRDAASAPIPNFASLRGIL